MMSVRMQPLQSTGISVTAPVGVMRAILGGALVNDVPSVNQRLPSEPLVMAVGSLFAVGTLNCFNVPTGAASAAVARDKARPVATAPVRIRPAFRDMRRAVSGDDVNTNEPPKGWVGLNPCTRRPVRGSPDTVDVLRTPRLCPSTCSN